MSLRIINPGLQTTLQGRPRLGHRHMGVPQSGPADPVSLALANRLVGNAPDATGLEITLGGVSCVFDAPVSVAIAGAPAPLTINTVEQSTHTTLNLSPGDQLDIGAVQVGLRVYLACAGGLIADMMLGSPSTYLPARLGGHDGRALQKGDTLDFCDPHLADTLETPADLRQVFTHGWALRACEGAEYAQLSAVSRQQLWSSSFAATNQLDRMGVRLSGHRFELRSDGKMKSAPVFPGTVQCPEDGQPILMGVDAQTTGGYARIAEIARCDRHLIGQIRHGDRVNFLHRTPDDAIQALKQKSKLLSDWIGAPIL